MQRNNLFSDLLPAAEILFDEPMAAHSTFRVGGPADVFLLPATAEELAAALRRCTEEQLPHVVIGRGSNLLVADEGYRGAVLCTARAEGASLQAVTADDADETVLTAGAGVTLQALAAFARDRGLTGLEFAAGIPGTVGGAMVMNAGAYGGECRDVTIRVRTVDGAGETHEHPVDEMAFGYRTSILKTNGEIVTGADFRLAPGDSEKITETMEELAKKRRDKQPLNYASAGSTWKRPDGYFAAKLIEEAGCKGLSVGDAQISEKHAGFLVNKGAARAADIRALMRMVEERVREQSGVQLEPEVVLLGF